MSAHSPVPLAPFFINRVPVRSNIVTRNNGRPDYAAIVAEAEKAVSAVNDPELKQAAFVKVLDTLLSAASEQSSDSSELDEGDEPSKKHKATKKKAAPKQVKRSSGPIGYIKELIDEGFFRTQRSIAAVKTELGNRGHHIPLTSLSGPFQRLCQQRLLRREKKTVGNKTIFVYSKY